MTQHITLKTVQASEFRSSQGELITTAIIPASELIERRSLKFSLSPNLRVPNQRKPSSIVTGILDRIESEKSLHIDSPILLSCRKSRLLPGQLSIVVDPDVDGIMDGGHRCRAFELASLKGLNLDQVTVQVQVYSGLDQKNLKNKAIQSNTSRSVSARSRQYFSGVYDELIAKIDMSKYPACFWRDGESPDATGIFCQGLHIIMLLSWISPDIYKRSGIGAIPNGRAKNPGIGNEKNTCSVSHLLKVAHLFDDVFSFEKRTINSLLNDTRFTSLVRMNPTLGQRISFQYPVKLLDGSEIMGRLPAAIAGPVIYPLRKMLSRDYQWQYPVKTWATKWNTYIVPKYIGELERFGASELSLGALVAGSPLLWKNMDALFNEWRDKQGFKDLY